MSMILNAARVAAALNIGLLLVLLVVWGRTYREIRSPLTLGSMEIGRASCRGKSVG